MKVEKQEQLFDVIIIGGGAAGLSAGLWCDELGLKTLVLESELQLGGQLVRVYNPIKNHLGIETENGRTLRDVFIKQVEKRNFEIRIESQVSDVDLEAKKVYLENGEFFFAKALIIATGVRRRKLNVEGEDKFKDRGIIESGKRDQDKVAGKKICVVGGGDAALENALILSESAAQVYLVHRREEFRARPEFIEKVLRNKKVKIFTETAVKKIMGGEMVEAVELQNLKSGEVMTLSLDAVLMRIGVQPNVELFQSRLLLNKVGYIEVGGNCETSIENIFAIGDVANPLAPTVSSAIGMGATAAKVVYSKFNNIFS